MLLVRGGVATQNEDPPFAVLLRQPPVLHRLQRRLRARRLHVRLPLQQRPGDLRPPARVLQPVPVRPVPSGAGVRRARGVSRRHVPAALGARSDVYDRERDDWSEGKSPDRSVGKTDRPGSQTTPGRPKRDLSATVTVL